MEVKAQECRIEVGGSGGQNYPLTPLRVFFWVCRHCGPRQSLAHLDQMPAEALEGGGGVICSPGALESLLFVPPTPAQPRVRGGEGPSAESLAGALTPEARAVPGSAFGALAPL